MATFGTNSTGMSDIANSPVTHPQLLQAMKACNMTVYRMWQEGSFTQPFPPSQYKYSLQWAAEGIDVVCVLNFQNSPQRGKVPTDEVWTSYINSIPEQSVTGIKYFEIGNEIDYNAYFTDTVANYARMLQIAYPILSSKGYKVICANLLFSLNWYKQLQALGAFKYCDLIGFHAYSNTPAQNFELIDTIIAFGATIGKGILCTEGNVRGKSSDLVEWSTMCEEYWSGLQSRVGTFLQFPVFYLPSDTLDIASLLTATYGQNKYFYNAMTTALGTAPVITPVPEKLSGTAIGTPGSYNNDGSTADKAFDGNPNTCFDNVTVGAWCGLDLGAPHQITEITFTPRAGWSGFLTRMLGGVFHGSNVADFSTGTVALYAIETTPKEGANTVAVTDTGKYRYVRYQGPPKSACNVAEIDFIGI